MYLSRVKVLAEQPDKLIAILKKDHYQIHQLLWELFPERGCETKRDFLFRRDESEGFPLFYLLSVTQPQNLPGVLKVESKVFNPNLNKGDKLTFSLRANPIIKSKRYAENPASDYTRHDVVMHLKKSLLAKGIAKEDLPSQARLTQDAGERWLQEKEAENGFKLLPVEIEARDDSDFEEEPEQKVFPVIVNGYQQHRFKKRNVSKPIVMSTLDFEGLLEVTDVEKFKKILFEGIGSAKAFGCGLMLIKRA